MGKWTLMPIALFMAAVISGAEARSVGPIGSIEEMNWWSDRVVHIRIESASIQTAHGVECGAKYIVTNLNIFKPGTVGTDATDRVFDRNLRLLSGREYILFLDELHDFEALVDRLPFTTAAKIRNGDLTAEERDLIWCNRNVPDLELGYSGAWEVVDKNRVRVPVPPRSWPLTIEVIKGRVGRSELIVSREDVFFYLHDVQNWRPALTYPGSDKEPLFPYR